MTEATRLGSLTTTTNRATTTKKIRLLPLVKEIVKKDGLLGLYRGFSPTLFASFPGQLSYYFGYEYSNEMFLRWLRQFIPSIPTATFISNACAGFVAEGISGLVYLPADIISQRLQIQQRLTFFDQRYQYRSSLGLFKKILAIEGVNGMYRGYGAYMSVFGPSSAVWWASYELVKNSLVSTIHSFSLNSQINHAVGMLVHFFSGAIAGAASVIATNPLDVARTRLQIMESTNASEKKQITAGFLSILRKTYVNEGLHGLYKGMKPRIYLKVPGSAIAFVGYEMIKESSKK